MFTRLDAIALIADSLLSLMLLVASLIIEWGVEEASIPRLGPAVAFGANCLLGPKLTLADATVNADYGSVDIVRASLF